MREEETLALLRAMMPDAQDLKPLRAVTISGGGDDGHVVNLCIAYGGHYWACETCEAQGMAENVPAGLSLLIDRATESTVDPVSVVMAGDTARLEYGPQVIAATPRAATDPELEEAAWDWHAGL
jgi:hypothetical protein